MAFLFVHFASGLFSNELESVAIAIALTTTALGTLMWTGSFSECFPRNRSAPFRGILAIVNAVSLAGMKFGRIVNW